MWCSAAEAYLWRGILGVDVNGFVDLSIVQEKERRKEKGLDIRVYLL